MQSGSAGGAISFVNSPSGPWTLGNVSQAALAASTISIKSAGQNVYVGGTVQSGPASSLAVSAGAGALLSGGGTLRSNTISLQANSSGAIGATTLPIQTGSNGGNTAISIGAAPAGPSAVAIAHAGAATLASVTIGAGAPFAVAASQDLTVASPISGASTIALKAAGAGSDLTLNAPVTGAAGTSKLQAGRAVLVNADVTAIGGNLMLIANDGAGAISMLDGTTLATGAGTGSIGIELQPGTGSGGIGGG